MCQCGIRKQLERLKTFMNSEGKIAPPSLDLSCLMTFEPGGQVYDGLIVLTHVYNLHSCNSYYGTMVLYVLGLIYSCYFILLFHSKAFAPPNLWNVGGSFAWRHWAWKIVCFYFSIHSIYAVRLSPCSQDAAPNRCLHQNYQTKKNCRTSGCPVLHHGLKRPSAVTVIPSRDVDKSQAFFALEWPRLRLQKPTFWQQSEYVISSSLHFSLRYVNWGMFVMDSLMAPLRQVGFVTVTGQKPWKNFRIWTYLDTLW